MGGGKIDIQAVLAILSATLAALALVLAWLLPDKTLFATLAGGIVSGSFLAAVGYYFGSSKDKKPAPPAGGGDAAS